jgi:hypothetical protein
MEDKELRRDFERLLRGVRSEPTARRRLAKIDPYVAREAEERLANLSREIERLEERAKFGGPNLPRD